MSALGAVSKCRDWGIDTVAHRRISATLDGVPCRTLSLAFPRARALTPMAQKNEDKRKKKKEKEQKWKLQLRTLFRGFVNTCRVSLLVVSLLHYLAESWFPYSPNDKAVLFVTFPSGASS
jgi:hypothetical protein